MKQLSEPMQKIKNDALNVPLKEMKNINEKWLKGEGLSDIEIIALYFFYNDLYKKLDILCPRYSLAYSDAVRTKESIGIVLWTRFLEDMPQLID